MFRAIYCDVEKRIFHHQELASLRIQTTRHIKYIVFWSDKDHYIQIQPTVCFLKGVHGVTGIIKNKKLCVL